MVQKKLSHTPIYTKVSSLKNENTIEQRPIINDKVAKFG